MEPEMLWVVEFFSNDVSNNDDAIKVTQARPFLLESLLIIAQA